MIFRVIIPVASSLTTHDSISKMRDNDEESQQTQTNNPRLVFN